MNKSIVLNLFWYNTKLHSKKNFRKFHADHNFYVAQRYRTKMAFAAAKQSLTADRRGRVDDLVAWCSRLFCALLPRGALSLLRKRVTLPCSKNTNKASSSSNWQINWTDNFILLMGINAYSYPKDINAWQLRHIPSYGLRKLITCITGSTTR